MTRAVQPWLETVPHPLAERAPVRLLIADGQQLTTLRNMVDLQSKGIELIDLVSNESELFAGSGPRSANVFLVDFDLPDRGGIEIGKSLLSMNPQAKVLVMMPEQRSEVVRNVMKEGLHGVLTSEMEIVTLVSAISCVLAGVAVLPASTAAAAVDRSPEERKANLRGRSLTQREREILGLLVEGLRGDAIASRLTLSNHTVRTHLYNLFRKLDVHSRSEAVGYAVRFEILDGDVEPPREQEQNDFKDRAGA